MEAATIKDDPEVSGVVKFGMKRAFNMFWNTSRSMMLEYDKSVAEAKTEASVDFAGTLMYEVVDTVFNSPDPVKSLALLKAFNQGEIQVTD